MNLGIWSKRGRFVFITTERERMGLMAQRLRNFFGYLGRHGYAKSIRP